MDRLEITGLPVVAAVTERPERQLRRDRRPRKDVPEAHPAEDEPAEGDAPHTVDDTA